MVDAQHFMVSNGVSFFSKYYHLNILLKGGILGPDLYPLGLNCRSLTAGLRAELGRHLNKKQ